MSERIEGVPVGTKLVRIGRPKNGDFFINVQGRVTAASLVGVDYYHWPIIVPDNVYGVVDLSTVAIREPGWEIAGDSASAAFYAVDSSDNNAFYLDISGIVFSARQLVYGFGDHRRIHVRMAKPKTRRVLVAEWPIHDSCDRDTHIGMAFTVADARHRAQTQPDVYRIEERACE